MRGPRSSRTARVLRGRRQDSRGKAADRPMSQLPTRQTGLLSPVAPPAPRGAARPRPLPPEPVLRVASRPLGRWARPHDSPRPRGCEQTRPPAACNVPTGPSAATIRARPTLGRGDATSPAAPRPAGAPGLRRRAADVLLRAAELGGCWRRGLTDPLRGVPGPWGAQEEGRTWLWVTEMNRGGQELSQGRRGRAGAQPSAAGWSRGHCPSWAPVTCCSGQRRLLPWLPVSSLS